jgi:mRNA-degrading endonuclease RelE of RelBE toxin-antitoxin system
MYRKNVGRKEKVFWVRVGDYRIQYVIYFNEKEILITVIDKRERVYHR